MKELVRRQVLQDLVVAAAAGEWGCEDLTAVTIERCDRITGGRNWTVTHVQNDDLPTGEHTVMAIVERLGQKYDLKDEQTAIQSK